MVIEKIEAEEEEQKTSGEYPISMGIYQTAKGYRISLRVRGDTIEDSGKRLDQACDKLINKVNELKEVTEFE